MLMYNKKTEEKRNVNDSMAKHLKSNTNWMELKTSITDTNAELLEAQETLKQRDKEMAELKAQLAKTESKDTEHKEVRGKKVNPEKGE